MKRKSLENLGSKASLVPRPRKYNSEVVSTELVIEMRQNRVGHLFYMVTYHLDNADHYVSFDSFDSVLDFIKSNFE